MVLTEHHVRTSMAPQKRNKVCWGVAGKRKEKRRAILHSIASIPAGSTSWDGQFYHSTSNALPGDHGGARAWMDHGGAGCVWRSGDSSRHEGSSWHDKGGAGQVRDVARGRSWGHGGWVRGRAEVAGTRQNCESALALENQFFHQDLGSGSGGRVAMGYPGVEISSGIG